jgi:hypothetical protein
MEQKTIFKYINNDGVNLNSYKKKYERKQELCSILNDEKLEYEKNGICDSYVEYGTPSLDNVVIKIKKKTHDTTDRLCKIINELKKIGEQYDENNSYYKKYIRNGGNINYTINEGVIEWFYTHKTNYKQIMKQYKNNDVALAVAFNEYIKNNGKDKYTERIRRSEMTVSIYI